MQSGIPQRQIPHYEIGCTKRRTRFGNAGYEGALSAGIISGPGHFLRSALRIELAECPQHLRYRAAFPTAGTLPRSVILTSLNGSRCGTLRAIRGLHTDASPFGCSIQLDESVMLPPIFAKRTLNRIFGVRTPIPIPLAPTSRPRLAAASGEAG